MDRRKSRSIKRKKRKGFYGVRPQEKIDNLNDPVTAMDSNPSTSSAISDCNVQSSESDVKNMSERKLLNSAFEEFDNNSGVMTRKQAKAVGLGCQANVEMATGFKLQDAVLLNDCISSAAICSSCRSATSQLQLFQKNNERKGLSESLFLKCTSCDAVTPLSTSKRLGGKGGGSHEVNRRAVLSSYQFGHAGLKNFCAGMNLPPPVTTKAYNEHLKQIEKASTNHAEQIMKDAAKRLKDKIATERPQAIDDQNDIEIARVAVTVDGTWQKRGHSSKIGVVFVISVDTGEILDYEVKSLFCHECKAHTLQDPGSDEHKEWLRKHEPNCSVNYKGPSEEMEAVAAVDIFSRSIKSRQLKYTTFVGDGDSSCFGKVKEAMFAKYGDTYEVTKEECVGHVQKRLGTALRKYKNDMKEKQLSDGKSVGGKGRLTDKVIDKMQNLYGKAIRENKGDLKGMQTSISAILNHMVKSEKLPLEQQHKHCPKSPNTWCKFWKDKQDKTQLYKEGNRLPEVFMKELQPIFTRLSNDGLLNRCLQGMTQNQNEAANGMLWSRCPKTRFCGARRVRIAVCETVAVFNTGSGSKAVVMKLCGISRPGIQTMRALRAQDQDRIKAAAKKVSLKYRERRKKLRAQRNAKEDQNAYRPGGFGLSSKPLEEAN